VEHLLDVMEIKALCRRAGIAEIDAGPKGASILFRKGQFANAQGLVAFIQASKGLLRLTPDQKLLFKAEWDVPSARLKGVRGLVQELAKVAEGG
jgi:transcription-repair coupling factor (superfamily II helicase)